MENVKVAEGVYVNRAVVLLGDGVHAVTWALNQLIADVEEFWDEDLDYAEEGQPDPWENMRWEYMRNEFREARNKISAAWDEFQNR